jgi:hypothetical protein
MECCEYGTLLTLTKLGVIPFFSLPLFENNFVSVDETASRQNVAAPFEM